MKFMTDEGKRTYSATHDKLCTSFSFLVSVFAGRKGITKDETRPDVFSVPGCGGDGGKELKEKRKKR